MKRSEAYRAAGMDRPIMAYGLVLYLTRREYAKLMRLSDAPRLATPEEIERSDEYAAEISRENEAWLRRLTALFSDNEKGSAGVRTPEGGE
jgi:hypothetical protein